MTAKSIKRVSVLQAITDFAQNTDDPAAKDVLLLLKLAKRVERKINTFKGHKLKAITVTVDGSTVDIPDDAYNVLKIYPGDLTGNIANYWADLYTIGISYETVYETDFIWSSLDKYQWVDSKLFDLINEEIVFPTSFNDQTFTIFYNTVELDSMGYMIVNESHIQAISTYFKQFFVERINYKSFRKARMLRGNDLEYQRQVKRDHFVAMASAKSEDLSISPMDQKEIDGVY